MKVRAYVEDTNRRERGCSESSECRCVSANRNQQVTGKCTPIKATWKPQVKNPRVRRIYLELPTAPLDVGQRLRRAQCRCRGGIRGFPHHRDRQPSRRMQARPWQGSSSKPSYVTRPCARGTSLFGQLNRHGCNTQRHGPAFFFHVSANHAQNDGESRTTLSYTTRYPHQR